MAHRWCWFVTEHDLILLVTCRGPIESQYSHLKDILETWRLRTPNEWERVSTWSDVMLWRNVIYNIVINAFQSVKDVAPHLHQLGYRDRAWSVNRQGYADHSFSNTPSSCTAVTYFVFCTTPVFIRIQSTECKHATLAANVSVPWLVA